MSSDSAVAVAITAEISGFREELKKLGPIADSNMKAVAAKLDKSIRDLEKAAKSSARSGREMNDVYKQTGDTFGKVGSSSAKAAGLLGMFSPEAAAAARALNDFADGGEVATEGAAALGVSVGTVGLGLVALAAAALPVIGQLQVYQRETAEAAARTEFLAAHAHDLDQALRGLEDAELRAAVATGQLTAAQAAQAQTDAQAQRAVEDFAKANEKERSAATDAYFASERRLQQLDFLPDVLKTAVDYYGGYTSAQQEALKTVKALDAEESAYTDIVQRTAMAQDVATVATAHRTAAADGLRESLQALNEAMAKETELANANTTSYYGALQSLMDQEEKARTSQLEGIDKIEAARASELADLKATLDEGLKAVDANSSAAETLREQARESELATNAAYDKQVAAAREDLAKKLADADAKAAAQSQQAAAAARQGWTDAIGAAADMADTIASDHTDAVSKLEEAEQNARERGQGARARAIAKNIAAERQAANEAFTIGQGVQLALAAMNAVQAEMNVLATVPYPATIPAAIAAGATAAADIVAIAAQSPPFHAGGLQGQTGGRPDESIRKFLDGEAALSRQGRRALGDETINRANAGLPVAGNAAPTVRAEVVFGHRHLDRVIRASARRRGTYLNDAAGSGRPGRS